MITVAQTKIVARLKCILRALNVVLVNVAIFLVLFLATEFATRAYSFAIRGRSFFRQDTFISCWITSYDYPPPIVSLTASSGFATERVLSHGKSQRIH